MDNVAGMRAAVVMHLLAVLLLSAVPAAADELQVDLDVSSSLEFNDNLRLVDDDIEATQGAILSAGAELQWSEEAWQLSLRPRVVGRRYTGDYELDSRDIFTTASFRRAMLRGEFEAAIDYSQESTLTSEFAATGAVDQNVPRAALVGRVSASRAVTPRATLSGSVLYQDVSYQGGLRYGLLDYDYWLLSGVTRMQLSERTDVNFIARAGLLDVPLTGDSSREITLGLGISRRLSERWQADFSAGPTFAAFDDGRSGTGYSYRAALAGNWERSELRLDADRLLSPVAGQGRLQTRQTFGASFSHAWRESMRASVYVAKELIEDVVQGQDRAPQSYQSGTERAGAVLTWQPASQWSWRAGYEHAVRTSDGSPSGNRVEVGLTWSARPRSHSL